MKLNVVRKVVVSASSEGVEQTKAKLEELSGAQAKVAQTANGMAVATEAADKRRISSAGSYNKMIERVDRLAMIERQHARDAALAAQQLREAAISTEEYTRAMGRIDAHYGQQVTLEEARRAKIAATTAELNQQTAATHRLAAANDNMSRQVRQNLMYQYNDVAVSLAGGMPAHMVAMQQGSQIIGGPGGLNAALKETGNLATMAVQRFGLIGAAIGVGAAAIANIRNEINETSDVQVSFGDVALAVWQSIAAGISNFIAPVTDQIAQWFGTAWDWVSEKTKDAANWIIRSVVGAIEYVKASVASLPAAFIAAGEAAAQGLANAIASGANSAIDNINSISAGINQIAGTEVLGMIERLQPPKIDIGGTAAAKEYVGVWRDYANTMSALSSRDIMGEWFGDIQQRALANAAAGLEEVGSAASSGGASLNSRTDEEADALLDRMLSPALAA